MVRYKFEHERENADTPKAMPLLSKLRRDILTSSLRPGQRLIEQDICAKYEVSRTPVREALRHLESEGLVKNIRNRGSLVSEITEQDFRDLFEMRKSAEIQAVRWAIDRITDKEMESLEETFEFMEFYTMRSDFNKMLVINNGFHSIIYEASHNRFLSKQLFYYQDLLRYKGLDAEHEERYLAVILEEHRRIFKAFIDKDPEDGAEAMEMHIERAAERRLA